MKKLIKWWEDEYYDNHSCKHCLYFKRIYPHEIEKGYCSANAQEEYEDDLICEAYEER